jgi:hypothetical protein
MNAHSRKKHLTFGYFVAGSYRVWGKRKAEGMIQLAINAHLIVFCAEQLFVVSWKLQLKPKNMEHSPRQFFHSRRHGSAQPPRPNLSRTAIPIIWGKELLQTIKIQRPHLALAAKGGRVHLQVRVARLAPDVQVQRIFASRQGIRVYRQPGL